MRVNLMQPITDLDGKTLNHEGKELILKDVIVQSLSAPLQEDRGGSTERIAERWALTVQIYGADEVDLTPEQLTMIRDRIVKFFTLVPAGRALDLLK